jgi:hypothetical protein
LGRHRPAAVNITLENRIFNLHLLCLTMPQSLCLVYGLLASLLAQTSAKPKAGGYHS